MTAISGLLDTNILIDVLREYPPAMLWLEQNTKSFFAVPSLVRMELILGVQNRLEQEKVIKLLRPYTLVYPSEFDAQWAMEQFEDHFLGYQIEIIDCFIAAMSVRLKLPVYTRNIKHLGVFTDVSLHVPY